MSLRIPTSLPEKKFLVVKMSGSNRFFFFFFLLLVCTVVVFKHQDFFHLKQQDREEYPWGIEAKTQIEAYKLLGKL